MHHDDTLNSAHRLPGLEVSVERDVPCTMEDGAVLRADIYRPTGSGPFPVILMRSPYDKTAGQSNFGYTHPTWYARHGYIVVQQDCRGRWSSDGDFYPFRSEATDGYRTIEWAASLPGTTGRVGMYGYSYPGVLQLQAAASRAPHLATICPGFCSHDFYDGWLYDRGAFRLAFAATWSAFLSSDTARRARDRSALEQAWSSRRNARASYWTLPLADYQGLDPRYAPFFFDWAAHPALDDFWLDQRVDLSAIAVPGLHVGGWFDAFVRGTIRSFRGIRKEAVEEATRSSQKLLIGPWMHDPWAPLWDHATDAGPMAVDDWQLRWFNHFLKDQDTGVLDAPVTAYVLGLGWMDLADWPPPDTHIHTFYLHSEGRANSVFGDGTLTDAMPEHEPPDIYYYDPCAPSMSVGGHSCCSHDVAPMGPADQADHESDPGVLVYTTRPFQTDVGIIGDVSLDLFAASTAVDADFVARLCLVDRAGVSRNVQEGIVRASYHDSLRTRTPIRPSTIIGYHLEIGPVALRVRQGERIRVDIASADFPQWDRNLNSMDDQAADLLASVPATQTILHTAAYPSRLNLPLLRLPRTPPEG